VLGLRNYVLRGRRNAEASLGNGMSDRRRVLKGEEKAVTAVDDAH
jgi:hypothetical protein